MVGLESSGASSGPSSPRDHHHLDETHHHHPPSSLSASPPSTSSECGSATSSRRPSLPEHMQDENYREKRKRNNDAAKRSREKRRKNDMEMEQRLLELTKENSLLKSRLTNLETSDPMPDPTPSSSSSVIVAGPSAPQQLLFQPPSMSAEPINPDLLYPLDLSQAAMAAAAAAAFKIPSCSAGSIFSPQLLAAFAAANPLLPPSMSQINNFDILSQLPHPTFRPFQCPSNTPAAPFMSAKSAFHPVQRPSVVELGPSQPRPSVTGQGESRSQQQTSVIHSTNPINKNGREISSRPSVVQPLDFSKSSASTHHLEHHVHFLDQLPSGQEPRSSIFVSNPNSIIKNNGTSHQPTIASRIQTPQQQPLPSSSMLPFQPPNIIPQPQPSILGSLLSTTTNRLSPTVPQSRTEKQSGLANNKPSASAATEDFKTSLSNLAVHLNSNSICQSSSSTNSGIKSDSDSLASPQSTRSGSVEHSHSQNSPIEGECASGGDSGEKGSNTKRSTPDLERYRDRRRRNNEAAKRCRANRRAAFEYRSKRSQQLEFENGELHQEILKLNNELENLKAIIASNNNRLLPLT